MKYRLYAVGIGPGAYEDMTLRAVETLRNSDVIIGYTVYVELIREHFPGKRFLTTPMKQEVQRCQIAFEEALAGQTVAMVCSGDAGVYGMAGLLLHMQADYPEVEVKVIPGVTAALSGAAVLGAPLIHDFAVISLSDLLTPWEVIERRLRSAAAGDFAICIYNPSSRKRHDYLRRACEILLETLSAETVCGYVMQIARDGEELCICTLGELREKEVNMFTTVFVGNRKTARRGDRMVTPRGYQNE